MRILKYLFLMIVLFAIGLTVYIATQNASFKVNGSQFIPVSKPTVFLYFNDLKNWESFASWNKSDNTKYSFSKNTIGSGATATFEGSNEGTIETKFSKQNDSISQKIVLNNQKSDVVWKFKDTIGGTVIKWSSKGKFDFKTKIIAFFKGGVSYSAGEILNQTITNVKNNLIYELTTFSIKINGIVTIDSTFYIKRSILTHEKNIRKNVKVLLPKVIDFVKKSNYSQNGSPFVMYNKLDRTNDIIDISVCIPIKDSINNLVSGEFASGILPKYQAVKVTLTGDHRHLLKAWNKGYLFIKRNRLANNFSEKVIEIQKISSLNEKRASKWQTEVILPIWPKRAYRKPTTSVATDTVTSPALSSPEVNEAPQ